MKYLIFVIAILALFGCAGEDAVSVDTDPPQRVLLVEHLGDTGDYIGGELQNYYSAPGIESNGIDADQGGDWIQVQWQHPLDEDISQVKIYRFSLEDYQDYIENIDIYEEDYDYSSLIDNINYTNSDFYVDKSSGLLGKTLFYFIGLVDEAGNETISDTLGYRLIDKATLINPSSSIISPDEMTFSWSLDSSQLPSDSRLLLFDQNYDLLWSYSPLEFDDTTEDYPGPALESQQLIWRVDVKGTINYYIIDGKSYTVFSGSESSEISFYLQR